MLLTATFPALTPAAIHAQRTAVRDRVREASPHFQTGTLEVLAASDLRLLFGAYDALFFQTQLRRLLAATNSQIFFEVSTRMTSTGATISHQALSKTNRVYRLAVSAPVLFASFQKAGEIFTVNGIRCGDRCEALQVLLEHELVHLYEMLTTGVSAHGPTFRRTALALFGHTDYRHALMTPVQQVSTALGLRPGDLVSFTFERRTLVGRLNRVTRRATVLVPDRDGVKYQDGHRYRKFYVPVDALTKVS